jgi:hypothetical protein
MDARSPVKAKERGSLPPRVAKLVFKGIKQIQCRLNIMDNIQDYESWNEGSTPSGDTSSRSSGLRSYGVIG